MSDTKENILLTALRLFARDGYETVSVSAIAGELGMTKGALYKHYRNKRDIFDSIVERMTEIDAGRAKRFGVPEAAFDQVPEAYRNTSADQVEGFIRANFRFWSEDAFARDFRKLLTLEQYRDPEMAELYQSCLAEGPIRYLEDLFREMMERGVWKGDDPRQLAVEFYAPFFLLLSIADAFPSRDAAELLAAQVERFIARNEA